MTSHPQAQPRAPYPRVSLSSWLALTRGHGAAVFRAARPMSLTAPLPTLQHPPHLMPAAMADIGVLRRDDAPAPVDLAQHARADALAIRLAVLVMHDLAGDPKARMHD